MDDGHVALEYILDAVKIRDLVVKQFVKDYKRDEWEIRQQVNYAVVEYNRSARQAAVEKGVEGFVEVHLAQTKRAWERIKVKYG